MSINNEEGYAVYHCGRCGYVDAVSESTIEWMHDVADSSLCCMTGEFGYDAAAGGRPQHVAVGLTEQQADTFVAEYRGKLKSLRPDSD